MQIPASSFVRQQVLFLENFIMKIKKERFYNNWAMSRENLSVGVCDQVRHKPVSATEPS